ncbi:MAG: hypothetical protein PHP23_10005 [Desulfobacterales bacterium]|nr:hypothetical protein [Desulfobacterales bacterium]MDD4070869.1 hypothetical protein [Desulfobacterales bacterium]MDD4392876.1 hypothetical protein [Desulfobacterales bacterium]
MEEIYNRAEWKSMDWNRIHMTVPAAWEISRIGKQYLMLEHRGLPALEIKWIPAGRSVKLQSLLKDINRNQGRTCPCVEPVPIPPVWEEAVAGFDDAACFRWKGKRLGGAGVLLSCRDCRQVILIQFIMPETPRVDPVNSTVLSSLVDQCAKERISWRVYDIHAVIPNEFELSYYHFRPGNFQLGFVSSKKEQLNLYRWAPASYLLRDSGLARFAAQTLNISPRMKIVRISEKPETMEWEMPHPSTDLRYRLWYAVSIRRRYRQIRICHQETESRITGVELLSRRPIQFTRFKRLCSGYVCL